MPPPVKLISEGEALWFGVPVMVVVAAVGINACALGCGAGWLGGTGCHSRVIAPSAQQRVQYIILPSD